MNTCPALQLRVADNDGLSAVNWGDSGTPLPAVTRCRQLDVFETLYIDHPEPCVTLAYSPKGVYDVDVHSITAPCQSG